MTGIPISAQQAPEPTQQRQSTTSLAHEGADNHYELPDELAELHDIPTRTGNEHVANGDNLVRRSTRQRQPTTKWLESLETADVAFETLLLGNEIDHPGHCQYPIAFATSSDPDTMHLDEAPLAPDRAELQKAMRKEINDEMTRKHWVIVSRSDVPKGVRVLPCVWSSMKRKRRIDIREVFKKWNARFAVHGGKQEFGVNY